MISVLFDIPVTMTFIGNIGHEGAARDVHDNIRYR